MIKNKGISKKLFAMASSVMMAAAIMAVPAHAATTYTPVAGGTFTFKKYFIMDAGDTVPNATFAFTVASGTAISVDTSQNEVMQVDQGVVPSGGIAGSVTFGPSDTANAATDFGANMIDVRRAASDRATGLTAATGVQMESGEKFVNKDVSLDFSGVNFTEPGIYRYVINETANTDHAGAGIMHDNDTDRILDVYVTDDGNGALVISGYVLHKNANDVAIGTTMGSDDVAAAGAALDDKTDGFTNEYNSKDLKFSKTVSGNQASRDKYFEFTAQVSGLNANDTYVVSIADDSDSNTTDGNADATSGTNAATIAANQSKSNPTSVTGAQLASGVKFYLQHGQSIAIRGLPQNAEYTITENAEDYSAAAVTGTGKANTGVIATIAGSNKYAEGGFVNTRNGVIPTGVVAALAGGLALAGVGAAGIGVMSRKKDEDEDEE